MGIKRRAYQSMSYNLKQKRKTLEEMGKSILKTVHEVERAKDSYVVHDYKYSKVVGVDAMKTWSTSSQTGIIN